MALYRAALEQNVAGETCVNVLYFDNTVGGEGAAQLVTELTTKWWNAMKNVVATGAFLSKVTATEVKRIGDSDTAEAYVNIAGGSDATPEAPQLALAYTIRTGFSGRTRRGRWFQAGIPDFYTTNGRVVAGMATSLANSISQVTAAFLGETPTSGFNLGVFSRTRYAIVSNPFDDYFKPATSVQHALILSTMRSRKPRT